MALFESSFTPTGTTPRRPATTPATSRRPSGTGCWAATPPPPMTEARVARSELVSAPQSSTSLAWEGMSRSEILPDLRQPSSSNPWIPQERPAREAGGGTGGLGRRDGRGALALLLGELERRDGRGALALLLGELGRQDGRGALMSSACSASSTNTAPGLGHIQAKVGGAFAASQRRRQGSAHGEREEGKDERKKKIVGTLVHKFYETRRRGTSNCSGTILI